MKTAQSRIITPEAEWQEAMLEISELLSSGIDAHGTNDQVQEFAGNVLKNMGSEANSNPKVTQAILNESSQLVTTILEKYRDISSSKKYYDFILSLNKGEDPLDNHHKHVSALSTLVTLAIDNVNMEGVSDIAAAGLVHDLCLKEIPQSFMEKHFKCERLSDKYLDQTYYRQLLHGYGKHIELVIQKLESENVSITEGAKKIIEQHHENYDGSGLLNLRDSKIYRPARILRIVDDLVTLVNHPVIPVSLNNAFHRLEKANLTGYQRQYDPEIMTAMKAKMFGA